MGTILNSSLWNNDASNSIEHIAEEQIRAIQFIQIPTENRLHEQAVNRYLTATDEELSLSPSPLLSCVYKP